MKGALVFVLISTLIAAPLFADTVVMKSGKSYTGEIIEETTEYIRLKTDSKILKIKKSAIATVIKPEVEVEVEVEEARPALGLDARAQGEADAESEVNKMAWVGIGFLLGLVGVIIAYAVTPTPPQARLIGKSPEYVTAYTQAFQSKAKSIQGTQSVVGCLVGTALSIGCWLVILSAAETETTY